MATMRLFSYLDATIRMQQSFLGPEQLLKEARFITSDQDVFLSHSSKDDHLVPGVIAFFKTFEATVYADDFDQRLPNPPNVATAGKLKEEIRQIPRLVVLATPNTHTSRWIPWELGLADGFRGVPPNAVLPITPEGDEPAWLKAEYFSLYPKIVNLDGAWRVIDPRKITSWPLKEWLHTKIV